MRKTIIASFVCVLSMQMSFAQKSAPENWFNLDLKKDKIPGVSSDRAYDELLKGKTGKTVVVAVIDDGTDIIHADLKDIIWVNEKEIPGNGIDDDGNGYVDDINGWNFIGGKDGDVQEDTYEITRMYAMLSSKYTSIDTNSLNAADKADYYQFQQIKKTYKEKANESKKMYEMMDGLSQAILSMKKQTGSDNPTEEQVKNFKPSNPMETIVKQAALKMLQKGATIAVLEQELKQASNHYGKGARYSFNTEFDSRTIVGDNYDDPYECCYGNNRVSGPQGKHGTHVAGIVAAVRNNGIGINGVASNVKIMVIRAVPDGDERDKDVANAIKYAVDNGATIINMSFGKAYSPYKKVVDEAVRYAVSKDVLLVHAAGNDNKNTDAESNFPLDKYEDGSGYATSWIEVGASSWEKKKKITAEFSNYAAQNVDVFAPGVDIYSTLPGNAYAKYNGTSMASPVTAGVAAMIRSYYPTLTAAQVKEILMESVTPVKGKVLLPGTQKKVKMKTLCKSGGIVNAYNAIKLADERAKGN